MKVRFSRATLGTTPARQRAPDHTHVFAHTHSNIQKSNKAVSRAAARAATEKHFTPKMESVVRLSVCGLTQRGVKCTNPLACRQARRRSQVAIGYHEHIYKTCASRRCGHVRRDLDAAGVFFCAGLLESVVRHGG